MNSPFARAARVLTVSLSLAFVAERIGDQLGRVVWFMGPSDWCAAPGYVQARFHGYKFKEWDPVKGSQIGRAVVAGVVDDVPFEFVGDPSPGSSKLRGSGDFGVWRWYGRDIARVRMVMRHESPDKSAGFPPVRSVYGFYDVPADVPACVASGL